MKSRYVNKPVIVCALPAYVGVEFFFLPVVVCQDGYGVENASAEVYGKGGYFIVIFMIPYVTAGRSYKMF
ncbi:MAG TPA: hypothetical protein DEP01_01165, partial [Aminobacterium sp.]|nr:hypothetical protein [Aminobacterium sp.]